MVQLPKTLDDAIAQAKDATQAALNDGNSRVQVELVFPEIALQAQSIAWQFIPIFTKYGSGLKVLFPDAGAAALARRDWGEIPFKVSDIGTSRSPIELKVQPEDEAFLIVSPSAVEVNQVEKLCNLAGDRPCVLLNPQLEDLKVVGIGYAARQLRERFLNTIESSYYLQPLDNAALVRSYPGLWQIWLETENNYQLLAEEPQKPVGDAIEQILARGTGTSDTDEPTPAPAKKPGLLTNLQRFLNALSR
ncbi:MULTISPECIES: DUF1995 family protein [unclassified Coleofasciculus]|uniref:DUF1995 family protein n=1 Tax=unclassified Coleofasciculus TaxID=2692782 RepID=UPI0018810B0E|nr:MULTISPECIES: DUF1995 family protein [unclassified Coleofasciculus]MBE9129577.1 DUF1995 family protein [Coleofasciculus sp. LEGE 07081]MBE9148257.1 DUF1995 family protein [Coleofasciculus sp. LEGE 07092]